MLKDKTLWKRGAAAEVIDEAGMSALYGCPSTSLRSARARSASAGILREVRVLKFEMCCAILSIGEHGLTQMPQTTKPS